MKTNGKYNLFLPWIIVSIASIFYGYEFLLRVAPSTMFHQFSLKFSLSDDKVGGMIIFYGIAYTPMQLFVGPIIDRYGVRNPLILAIALCTAGTCLLSFTNSVMLCKLSMFMMGFGSAFAFVGVMKLASLQLPERHLGFVSGITTMIGMLGAIFGQSFTAFVNMNFPWQTSWNIYTIIGCIIIFIAYLALPKCKSNTHDIFNFRQFLNNLKVLTTDIDLLLCGVVGGVLFMPISVFGTLWGVQFITTVSHQNVSTASNIVIFIFAGMAVGGPISGLINKYINEEILLLWSCLLTSIASCHLILYTPQTKLLLECELFFLGLICGAEVLAFSIAIRKSRKELAGSATSFVNFIIMGVGTIVQYIIGCLLSLYPKHLGVSHLSVYDAKAYQIAVSTIPVLLIIISVIYFIRWKFKNRTYKIRDDYQLNSGYAYQRTQTQTI